MSLIENLKMKCSVSFGSPQVKECLLVISAKWFGIPYLGPEVDVSYIEKEDFSPRKQLQHILMEMQVLKIKTQYP